MKSLSRVQLSDPMDCSLPGSSIHGIFQARVLEWGAVAFSDIKKRCKNAQKNYTKKIFNDPDNHDGMITHLEPDILEWEVKWTLGSITTNKASGGDGIPVDISNPERWCCESAAFNTPANLENSAVATGLEKVSFHSNAKERQCQRMLKLPHNCTHLTR